MISASKIGFSVVLCLAFVSGNGVALVQGGIQDASQKQVSEAGGTRILSDLPHWNMEYKWKPEDRTKYESGIDKLMAFDSPTLRWLLKNHLSEVDPNKEEDFEEYKARLYDVYAIIKYSFVIPDDETSLQAGLPFLVTDSSGYKDLQKGLIYESWPWRTDKEGKTRLVGRVPAYRGLWPPQVLNLFDLYCTKYFRRKQ